MIAQYTQAAMVAENRRLAAPASVDSLPTSAMQEDHVSMGWGAARKLRAALANLTRILAVELTCAARGARAARAAGAGARDAARRWPRCAAPFPASGPDRSLAPELGRGRGWSRGGRARPRSRTAIGELAVSGPRRCGRRAAASSPAAAGPRRRRCGC